jgi:hypothetical protein
MIIDGHAHIGEDPEVSLSARELIASMDRLSIDMAVVCPMGSELVVRNREGNERVARAVEEHKGRLAGFATANPWWGEWAVEELHRAFKELRLQGLKLHPALQGFRADDRLVHPLIEEAVKHHAPIYIHTGTPVYSLPLQVAELADTFPEAQIILGHMGFADLWTDMVGITRGRENLYIETSRMSSTDLIRQVVREAGADRVIFGSDTPYMPQHLELEKLHRLQLGDEELQLILGGNMARLLGLKEET